MQLPPPDPRVQTEINTSTLVDVVGPGNPLLSMALVFIKGLFFKSRGPDRLRVPGYGLPIDSTPKPGGVETFRHGANDFVPERMTAREVAMHQVANEITEKPDWEKKIFNDEIVTRWKTEALGHRDMSEVAFDWILRELQEKSEFSLEEAFFTVFDSASPCVKSDKLVSKEIQQEVKDATQALLDLPHPDWHPNSNDQVRNLVHPSLFPLVYGRSRIVESGDVGLDNCVEFMGKGEPISVPENSSAQREGRQNEISSLWSTKFQWLPCNVQFSGDSGTDVKITSYINNLHPVKYPAIYEVIEKLISLSIKPWNEILVRGYAGRYPLRIKTLGVETIGDDGAPDWMPPLNAVEPVPDDVRKAVREYMALPDGPHYDPEDEDMIVPDNVDELQGWELYEAIQAKTQRIRRYVVPDPGQTFEEWEEGKVRAVVSGYRDFGSSFEHDLYEVKLEDDFRNTGLQVIVKIAGIELTPENPSYAGGNWHLEGMNNEHIVATSIYYYDVENITESGVRFRQEAELPETDLSYEQNDHKPLETVFGTSLTQAPAIQEIGHITTTDGRFLAFPNTLQHCVQPFELMDKTRPGHRRFIVLWLVDPHIPVISTAHVPPQQHDWWAEEVQRDSGIKVPTEVLDMIMQRTDDWPMGLDEAKALRLELMKERTDFGTDVQSGVGMYFLCEH